VFNAILYNLKDRKLISPDELRQSPVMLTLVVNSPLMLGPGYYKYIAIDEAGYVRRHFLSSMMNSTLPAIFHHFIELIRSAEHIILLQHALTREDVQFYTEIDSIECEN
jgi:hypothetical protein